MERPQQIADLMAALIRLLVDHPEEVRIQIIDRPEGAMLLKVSLAQTDVGKVIGKSGRTARSLRCILESISKSTKQKFILDIGS